MYALQSVAIKNTVPLAEAQAHYKKITKKKPRKVREEGEWWRFRYMPPTRFKKGTFRTKVVNDNIHLIFGELEGTHAKLEGRGLFDYFTKAYDYVANKASDAFSYVKNAVSITDYSATTKKLLEEYGKNEITRMTIRRVPIAFAIDLALQGVSAGKWEELKEKYGFDKFFHLSLIVYLKNAYEKTALRKGRKIPKQLSVEKLEVVSVNERVEPVEGQEEQEVPIPKGQKITIDGMFEKTRQRMGETAFFAYSALGQNNCQDFVSNLLQSEGLYREPEKQFVFQDLSELAKELPESTLAISQGITHLGALANKYLGIGGTKNEIIIPLEGGTHRENVLKKWKLEDKGYSLAELASITGVPEKTLQEVYNRGIGAYTAPGGGVAKSVRLKGSYMKNVSAPASKKLSKENWAFARVFSYLDGNPSHDNDLRKNVGGANVGLNDLLSKDRMEQVGGTRNSGFIRAMLARDKAQEAGQDVDTVENRKKFKYLDKQGFKIQKLTKTTHDLAQKKKARLPDTSHRQQVEQFYDYVIANAPAHKPDWDGGIHYGDTYDLDDLFTKWNESRGAEVREKRQAKREQEDESFSIPADFFKLPPVRKRPQIAPVPPPVVPIEDLPKDSDEKEEVVLAKFDDPRTKFQEEINKLVDFGMKNLHFDDLIADVLSGREGRGTSGIPTAGEMVVMYYFILKYKIPILDFDYEDINYVPKVMNYRSKYTKDFTKTMLRVYNITEYATEAVQKKNINKIYDEVSLHLSKGEPQLLFYTNLGLRGKSLHANFVLIRAVDKKVYLIDPHGKQDIRDYKAQYEKQEKIFGGLATKLGYEYVPSEMSSPYAVKSLQAELHNMDIRKSDMSEERKQMYLMQTEKKYGFQTIENMLGRKEGFCGWWGAFMIELACLKPTIPFEAVLKETSELLTSDPIKVYKAIVKYQYMLQQVVVEIATKAGLKDVEHAPLDNLLGVVAGTLSVRLTQLKEKRKEILGYAKPI